MQPNYMSMSGYGSGYQPMDTFALTQPEAIPDWRSSYLPKPRSFAVGAPVGMPEPVAAPVFNYETDMAGLMPTSAPLGGTPTNSQIFQDIGGFGSGNGSVPFFSTRDKQGYGSFALQGASALANLYMGMKQYGLAKDQLAFQKDSFNKQYDANKSLTNSRLEDRQARRVLENPNATGVADYMAKWGVK